MCRFICDADTRTAFKNTEGIPRCLESYYIEKRKELLLDWTSGLRLAPLLETTFAITQDGVITKWVLIDELPTTYAEVVNISSARQTSWVAWKRFQSLRVFGTSWCECPRHQQSDFCKHCAAAQAYLGCMSAPPKEVISALDWNKKVIKKRGGDEVEVLRMLRAESV